MSQLRAALQAALERPGAITKKELRALVFENPATRRPSPVDAAGRVLDFINERAGYVTAARQGGVDSYDYARWQGHMEARRQLATALGHTVPYEPSDRTKPINDGATE